MYDINNQAPGIPARVNLQHGNPSLIAASS
jgi:hypothetical protein